MLILGTEFLKSDATTQFAAQNRIFRDKLAGKQVQILKGYFKGQKARVVQINGEMAILELQTRPEKITIPKTDIMETAGQDSD